VAGLLALNVFVSPYPVIEFFDANPVAVAPGEASNLSWSVIGASYVEIDHEIGSVGLRGSTLVTPADTSIYTLTAVKGTRNRSLDVKVVVQ